VADIEEVRTATVRGFGPRWAERADALTEAFGPWLTEPMTEPMAEPVAEPAEPVTDVEPEDR
jgi:hypothetical protein